MTAEEFAALKKGDRIVNRDATRVVWIVGRRLSFGVRIKPEPSTPLAAFALWGPRLKSGTAVKPGLWLAAPKQST